MLQRKVLIINSNMNFASSLKDIFEKNGYLVVGVANGVYSGMDSIQDHKPDIIVSGLKLKDGSGISVFENLITHSPLLQPTVVVVISAFLDLAAKDYIRNQFKDTNIKVLYFNKKYDYSPESLISVLSLKENFFSNEATDNSTSSLSHFEIDASTSMPLKAFIREILTFHCVPQNMTGFLDLLFIVEYVILEELNKIDIEDLYDLVAEDRGVTSDSVKKGIYRLFQAAFPKNKNFDFPTTPKKFIQYIVREVNSKSA